MREEYEQAPIAERQLWHEQLRQRLMNSDPDPLPTKPIIEKSAKFVR
jgi:hypothetical protein